MIAVFFRIILGMIFLTSGIEKAVSARENFLYVIQAYAVLPSALEHLASWVFPWIEIVVGAFLVTGLWLRWTLKGSMLMNGMLLIMVGQAILRQLPIDNCGCFGNLVHIPLKGVFLLDVAMFMTALILLKCFDKAKRFSFDAWYE